MILTLKQLREILDALSVRNPAFEGERKLILVQAPADGKTFCEEGATPTLWPRTDIRQEVEAVAVLRTEPPQFGRRPRPHPNLQWKLNTEGVLLP